MVLSTSIVWNIVCIATKSKKKHHTLELCSEDVLLISILLSAQLYLLIFTFTLCESHGYKPKRVLKSAYILSCYTNAVDTHVEREMRYLCSKGISNSHFDADKKPQAKISFKTNNNKALAHKDFNSSTRTPFCVQHFRHTSSSGSSKWNPFITFVRFALHIFLPQMRPRPTNFHGKILENEVFYHRYKNGAKTKATKKCSHTKSMDARLVIAPDKQLESLNLRHRHSISLQKI